MVSLEEIITTLVLPILVGVILSFILTYLIEVRSRRRKRQMQSLIEKFETDEVPAETMISQALESENEDRKAAFIILVVDVERQLRELAFSIVGSQKPRPISDIVNLLIEQGILDEKWRSSFKSLWDIRSRVIHGLDATDSEIRVGTMLAASLKLDLERIRKKRKQELPSSKFEVYKDAAGKFRWRLKAPNGEILAVSEAYESKIACANSIEAVRRHFPVAEIQYLNE